ncbi:hypothetical protein DTO207G8_1658 [Paecilomyces variotii]|nr:hypothetical protein DTO207G8_1658 [Paecilomyces variotii]
MASLTTLRAVTHRLTTTPVNQLPQIAAFLATALGDCADILSAPQSQNNARSESDASLQVHKLKTRLTGLLQDRSIEGRWTAVILVKATIEAGRWEILRGCEPWVRGLLSVLGKPDPTSTKKLCIITLTRIFHLTYQYQTLVREITTPSLPGFITSCLNAVSVKPTSEPTRVLKPNASLLETVLHALTDLIARHPTVLRPFSAQIHSLLIAIIGTSGQSFPEAVNRLAHRLFISLHNCAPKNTHGEEWKAALRLTISSTHRAADYTFRAVVEQWESTDSTLRQVARPHDYSQQAGDWESDPLGLPGWQGIHAGSDRLTNLLHLLSGFISTRTAATVNIPLGSILDLTSRLASVTVPPEGKDTLESTVQLNPQIGRDERESLWSELPRIHVACLELFMTVVDLLETGVVPVAQNMLEQALWIFDSEKFNKDVRTAFYALLCRLLPLIGRSMRKQHISTLSPLIRTCCQDLLPSGVDSQSAQNQQSESKGKSKSKQGSLNADAFLNADVRKVQQLRDIASVQGLQLAASRLLTVLLVWLPAEHVPPPLRAEIDRTVILTQNKEAMMASVLNPVPVVKGRRANPSIMPFLAREYNAELDVEGLLRPRMPVLLGGPERNMSMIDGEDEEEDEVTTPRYEAARPATDTLDRFLPASHNQVAVEAEVAQDLINAHSKRTYPGDAMETDAPRPSAITNGESKKMRLESANAPTLLERTFPTPAASSIVATDQGAAATVPVTMSEASATPATAPSVSGPSAPSVSNPSVSVPASVATRFEATGAQGGAAATQDDEDSDEELPALNIEPDTDDEDEEDVDMEG